MNFLFRHVKLAGNSAKDFLFTSSNMIHKARLLASVANAALCRDITPFIASALIAFLPIAYLGGCMKERPFLISFLKPHNEKRALPLCALFVKYGSCSPIDHSFPKGYRPLMETRAVSLESASKTILKIAQASELQVCTFKDALIFSLKVYGE